MKGVNIFLAGGFEDVEALAVNDVLRRGGVTTRLVSISDDLYVSSSHGVTVKADVLFKDAASCHDGTTEKDVMIFPGGMPGTKNLAACRSLIEAMKEHYATGGTVAAICAAPGLVLGQLGDCLKGVSFTCFDGFEELPAKCGAVFSPKAAVSCGRIITGRSAGHAISFGLAILEKVTDNRTAEKTSNAMYLKWTA